MCSPLLLPPSHLPVAFIKWITFPRSSLLICPLGWWGFGPEERTGAALSSSWFLGLNSSSHSRLFVDFAFFPLELSRHCSIVSLVSPGCLMFFPLQAFSAWMSEEVFVYPPSSISEPGYNLMSATAYNFSWCPFDLKIYNLFLLICLSEYIFFISVVGCLIPRHQLSLYWIIFGLGSYYPLLHTVIFGFLLWVFH